jgi:cysteinyl-tRNA synthetase
MEKNNKSKLKLYNSLTRKKEDFSPMIESTVRIYACGPTVYGPTHLGHAKTLLAYDLMRKYFKIFKNWNVFYIQNITDVGHIVGDIDEGEDKLQKQARIEKIHPMEIADKYIKDMWDSLDALGCERPNIAPRATGHIVEIIDSVSDLIKKGFAYESKGDVYFKVSNFEKYGKLSGNTTDKLMGGTRVEASPNKKSPLDFALWKKADPGHIMQWNSPWGKGYPGWHIECSVMSSKYLGIPFDIHGGAVELKFPHHENEIAQSEALYGGFAGLWAHTGMLMVDGKKMGKSLGNFITVEDALKKYRAETLRFFILTSHYRSILDLREESIYNAEKNLQKINNFIFQLRQKAGDKYNIEMNKLMLEFEADFEAAMNDDLNTPVALASLLSFVNQTNKLIAEKKYGRKNLKEIMDLFSKINLLFGGLEQDPDCQEEAIKDSEIKDLVERRRLAKSEKNWKLADEIRQTLEEKGIMIFDQKDGGTIYKKLETA